MIFEKIIGGIISVGICLSNSYNDRVVYIKKEEVKVSYIKTISPDKVKILTRR